MIPWIVLGLIVVLLLALIALFNKLIKLRNQVREGWSGIDVQLKRRHDLVPNLVEIVKGYAKHESDLFERVVELRNRSREAKGPSESEAAETAFGQSIGQLFALAENYPDLKAGENFLKLQEQLTEVEDHIQLARRYYNGAVRDFNTGIEMFPGNLVAGLFTFQPESFFELDSVAERDAPSVNLNREES